MCPDSAHSRPQPRACSSQGHRSRPAHLGRHLKRDPLQCRTILARTCPRMKPLRKLENHEPLRMGDRGHEDEFADAEGSGDDAAAADAGVVEAGEKIQGVMVGGSEDFVEHSPRLR